MIDDLRIGFRMLRKSPGFAFLAIGCLVLGIGANAAVFSWIEGILLRPYPLVADQDRLFAVAGTTKGGTTLDEMSWQDFLDLRRGSTLVQDFIAEKITGTTLTIGDRAVRVPGSIVSANYFDAIGVHPVLGRGFLPVEDEGYNAHPVAVVSYETWHDRFQGDPAIVGKTQILNGLPFTIVGVAPQGFYGTFVGYAFQFWVPASMQAQFAAGVYKLDDRGARWIEGYVRLKPGVAMAQAQAELSAIASRLEAIYPTTNRGRGVRLFPLWETPFNNAGALLPTLGVALVVVLAVLLIACANVANLLLVRAFTRQQEMTVRLSLGAGRSRLVRQLLTEGAIMAVLATIGGLLLAYWLENGLASLVPPRGGIVLRLAGNLDWRVMALSVAVSVGATVLFGLAPALISSSIDLAGTLRAQSGSVVGSRGRAWVRSGLVLIQVSLSFVLLAGAGLLMKSLLQVRETSPGFSTRGVVTTSIDLFTAGYDRPRARVFQDQLIERLEGTGLVDSAAFSRMVPFTFSTYGSAAIAVDGFNVLADQQPTAAYNQIGPDYLKTMGIPIVSGRDFVRADDETAPSVVIIDETMANVYWRGVDSVGRHLRVNGREATVIGVARTAKYRNLFESAQPFFYVPLRQDTSATGATFAALELRTAQSPTAITARLVREVRSIDPTVAPMEVITMQEQVDRTTAPQRIAITMLGGFGALALLLAGVGLYGVMASTVAQSARELALRMALGATGLDLLQLVMLKGLGLMALGLTVGLGAALGLTRLLGYLLYQVSPRDPLAFGSAGLVIGVASIVACGIPAWRAARTDPLRVLRT